MKSFDIEDNKKSSFVKKIPIIGSWLGNAKSMMAEYDKLSVQVDKIQGELDKARMTMLKDIVMFDNMYERNLEYFKEFYSYIKSWQRKNKVDYRKNYS